VRSGPIDSQGRALRWKAGLDYLFTRNLSVGVGNLGHYITVDKEKNGIETLPDNRTLAHTALLRLGLRF